MESEGGVLPARQVIERDTFKVYDTWRNLGPGKSHGGERPLLAGEEMTYWRMQLHPNEPGEALKHCVESLAAGYIGLDFAAEVGDLKETTQSALPKNERDYWAFAHEMHIGDKVLIIAHHFPFALATVAGDYNYIRSYAREIGVWFRHFRRVKDVRYYGDLVTNAKDWEPIKMTDTISPLRDASSKSYQLIDAWSRSG